MLAKLISLSNRGFLVITGEDRKKFLQGLVTNDVNKISSPPLSRNLQTASANATLGSAELRPLVALDAHSGASCRPFRPSDSSSVAPAPLNRGEELLPGLNCELKLASRSSTGLLYTCMLSASGRFLYDFFIFEDGEKLVLEHSQDRSEELLNKLNSYKLRNKVTIEASSQYHVAQLIHWASKASPTKNNFTFLDPRNAKLGFRVYSKKEIVAEKAMGTGTENDYDLLRISLKIAEGEKDLTYDKSFPLEFGFDDLHAIDYEKGCYVGQELTARTHHLGQIRKKLFHVELVDLGEVSKGEEVIYEGEKVGTILSSALSSDGKLNALALIRTEEGHDFESLREKLLVGGKKVVIV